MIPVDSEKTQGVVCCAGSAAPQSSGVLRRLLRQREAGMFLALLGLIALIWYFQPAFLRSNNVYLVSRQVAYTAIVALGVFFVILTSGIDLSIGSTVSLAGVICGLLLAANTPLPVAIAGGLAIGALVGLVNGVIVAYVGVTSFIVSLGMLGMARGVVLLIKGGDSIRDIPQSFIDLGLMDFRLVPQSLASYPVLKYLPVIPMPVVILVLLAIVSHVVLTYTIFGRRVYAVGGNEAATELSGINTRRVKLLAYVLSGLLSAVTGVLYIARFGSAQADAGKGMEMDAIAAAVIGGTSLMGGEGTVLGVLIGATIMAVIKNGLTLVNISPYWQDLIIGAIIVLAAILDRVRKRRR